jgi:hypothetical protein
MDTAIEPLEIPPDRSWRYDGRFIISRVADKNGNLVRELRLRRWARGQGANADQARKDEGRNSSGYPVHSGCR